MKAKILYILASALLGTSAASAQALSPDTVMTVNNPQRVVITENSRGVTVAVSGAGDDTEFRTVHTEPYPDGAVIKTRQSVEEPWYERRLRHSDFTVGIGGLMLGFVSAPGAPDGMELEMGKSFEIGLAEALTFGYCSPGGAHTISAGIGFTWRNYRTTLGTRYMSDADGTGIITEPWPDDVKGRFARLKVFSLTFPILYEYKFGFKLPGSHSRFALKGGAILNWNSHGSVKSAWTDADDRDVMYTSNNIGQRKFTVDFMVAVKPMPVIGVYLKYSPMDVLQAGHGLAFRTLSTGLILCF